MSQKSSYWLYSDLTCTQCGKFYTACRCIGIPKCEKCGKLLVWSPFHWCAVSPKKEIKKTVADEAKEIVWGEREKEYGHPRIFLQRFAEVANGVLANKLKEKLTPEDMCIIMIVMKTARLINNPDNRDTLRDICGYALVLERCLDWQKDAQTVSKKG